MTNILAFTGNLFAPRARRTDPSAARRWVPIIFRPEQPDTSADLHGHHTRILSAAVAILEQGEALLNALTAESFARRVPAVFNACIGGHYRHCLDHFTSLLQATGTDLVDYDRRERDARIEAQPDFALFVTRDLKARLNALTDAALAASVSARCEVSYEHGDSPSTRSTFARELAYCIAHAIHHFALISVMARLLEVRLPENFGVAPSTVAHLTKVNGR